MYNIGDLIVHESTGVCKITDICVPEFMTGEKRHLCYMIRPVFGKNTVIYTPVDSDKVFLRPVMTKEMAMSYLGRIAQEEVDTIQAKKSAELEDKYRKAMKNTTCYDLMKLQRSILKRRRECVADGRVVSQVDDKYYKNLKKLISEELSIALEIPVEQVGDFIGDYVKDKEFLLV